jgi:photosystem II stability/assembly factor-like uncharacterized protein
MKKIWAFILAFCFTACNAIPATNSPVEGIPANPEFPPITPTIFPEATLISITETASPLLPIPILSATERTNLPLKSGQRVDITSIEMFDSQVGWGFDSDGHILRTRDGGMNWQAVTPPTSYYSPTGFFALDADTAWATFSLGIYSYPKTAYVWHTEDGGKTWKPSQPFHLDLDVDGNDNPSDYYKPYRLQFIDRQTGWLLVDVFSGMNSTRPLLFLTSNGGENWLLVNDHYHDLNDAVGAGFAFIDHRTGWYGQNNIPIKMGNDRIDTIISDGGWKLIKTHDGGRSFTDFTLLPLPSELQQPELAAKEADCGETRLLTIAPMVVGVEWDCVIDPPTLYRFFAFSADGGETWNSWLASGNEFFLDGTRGWRLLSSGQLQQTKDGGLHWLTVKSVTWTNAQFDFINEREGWAIASNAETTALLHTPDGGATWTDIKPIIAP